MSQSVNTDTSSPKVKRSYRKGHPLSATERQQKSVARKRTTHKEVKVFVQSEIKDTFIELCEAEGVTQAEMIEKWIKRESKSNNNIS
ncbi:replication regulatory protein RepA [Pantoea agglomerans]|uniref:replication regulatory protein RepA n=1 Tax=Enterobacter agglomerans TaxID=549 RepID=UPI003208A868